MNHRYSNPRTDDRNQKDDKPPYSRIFVVCSKQLRENDLKAPFSEYGEIKDLYMPRDRSTGESKGIAYIQYRKTSEAATAIQEMHNNTIGTDSKTVKVMIASNKNDSHDVNEDKCNRLFIKISTQDTESDVRKVFAPFGQIESVQIHRDKFTDANKGFAYVTYKTFLDAAKAYENCEKKYKAVFATPKDQLKRSRNTVEPVMDHFYSNNSSFSDKDFAFDHHAMQKNIPIKAGATGYKTVCATCSPVVSQRHIEKLFNIVPGMVRCQYSVDSYNGMCKVMVTYDNEKSATHAIERLNNFEYPSGEVITVKPQQTDLLKGVNALTEILNSFNAVDSINPDLLQLATVISKATTLIKEAASVRMEQKTEMNDINFCSVPLPPLKPMADSGSRIAQRCFVVCKPSPPSPAILRDVFSRFGDLIDVSIFPNKTFGFAKYTSMKAAQDAIKTLDGATLCGCILRVIEADEKVNDREKKETNVENENTDLEGERKKIRLEEMETNSN